MHKHPNHYTRRHSYHAHSTPWIVVVLTVALLAAPMSAGWAQDRPVHDQIHSETPTQFGIGAASVLASIPYGAAKITYAALGGIIGGFAYVFSGGDKDAAKAVWIPSLRGTYVLTPDHLKGDKQIQFMGKADGDDMEQQAHAGHPIRIVVTDTR